MLRGIFYICLLASFLSFSSAVPDCAPPPYVALPPETAPSPTPTTSPVAASSPINNGSVSGDITWWCSKTPHAEACNYYFRKSQHNNINRPPRFRSEFLRMLVHIALDEAVITHSQTLKFGPSCTNNQRKAAWSDCVKLFENTVAQLNRTLRGLNPSAEADDVRCTNFDAQTWLSTAQTNIETCRSGSEDLKVSDFVIPAISNQNMSDLIGNCLAVNGVLMKQHNHTTGTF